MPGHLRSALQDRARRLLLETAVGRLLMMAPRTVMALKAARIAPQICAVARWAMTSRERVNFTYATTRESDLLLCALVAEIAGVPTDQVVAHLDALLADAEIIAHVAAESRTRAARHRVDPGFKPGRRIAFYLLTRALKPRLVVEAGVDRGLGALLISRALALNRREGHPGDYLGIEFSAGKPVPLYESYAGKIGRIERGDFVAILQRETRAIDLFIHDTIPDDAHVTAQLTAVQRRLSPDGIIASTWTTRAFIDHAEAHGLGLLTHQEMTSRHWFAGDRVAVLFPRRLAPSVPGPRLWGRPAGGPGGR